MDLSQLLLFVSTLTWTLEEATSWAHEFVNPLVRDEHDLGAGESWIRLLSAAKNVAFIHCRRPIILAVPRLSIPARKVPIAVVLSADLEEKVFTANQSALESAFPGTSSSPVVTDQFSLEDLWYATV